MSSELFWTVVLVLLFLLPVVGFALTFKWLRRVRNNALDELPDLAAQRETAIKALRGFTHDVNVDGDNHVRIICFTSKRCYLVGKMTFFEVDLAIAAAEKLVGNVTVYTLSAKNES